MSDNDLAMHLFPNKHTLASVGSLERPLRIYYKYWTSVSAVNLVQMLILIFIIIKSLGNVTTIATTYRTTAARSIQVQSM